MHPLELQRKHLITLHYFDKFAHQGVLPGPHHFLTYARSRSSICTQQIFDAFPQILRLYCLIRLFASVRVLLTARLSGGSARILLQSYHLVMLVRLPVLKYLTEVDCLLAVKLFSGTHFTISSDLLLPITIW